jgi:hypothetical protein
MRLIRIKSDRIVDLLEKTNPQKLPPADRYWGKTTMRGSSIPLALDGFPRAAERSALHPERSQPQGCINPIT